MAVLLFSKGKERQDYYTLDADITCVGRDAECEIALGDASVSRRHARIRKTASGFEVEDLNSKNGVFIDGRRTAKARLTDGCAVRFGAVEAVFREHFDDELTFDGREESLTVFFDREELSLLPRRLRGLYELADAAGEAESETAAAQTALDILLRELNCDNAYVGFCDGAARLPTRGFHRTAAGRTERFALSRTILAKTLAAGRHLLIANVGLDAELQDLASIQATAVKSVLCVPMQAAGRVFGVLYADTRSIVRPFSKDDLAFASALASLLAAILGHLRVIAGLREAHQALQKQLDGLELVGGSAPMARVREQLGKFAAKGAATVLILGPSGSGKELAARLIHRQSTRADKPFLDVNCAAFPKDLIESELFGHVKGAFTSATNDRRGLFQMADHGCLFLDEIAEMPHDLQGKLLRVLETGQFRPVGSDRAVTVDVRIIAATNKDLAELVKQKAFREDLFYRLNVLSVTMPGLADRREDIPELSAHFLAALRARINTRANGFSPEALARLQRHDWPGNVRELRNVIERALYICEDDLIEADHLIGFADEEAIDETAPDEPLAERGRLEREIEDLERVRLRDALERHRWNRSRAAAELGIARKTLQAKMKKYDL